MHNTDGSALAASSDSALTTNQLTPIVPYPAPFAVPSPCDAAAYITAGGCTFSWQPTGQQGPQWSCLNPNLLETCTIMHHNSISDSSQGGPAQLGQAGGLAGQSEGTQAASFQPRGQSEQLQSQQLTVTVQSECLDS